jgi:hypothetical protein
MSSRFYYLFEYLSNDLFENITGIRLGIKDLRKIRVVQLERRSDAYLSQIRDGLKDEFGIEVEIIDEVIQIPKRAIEKGGYLFTPRLVNHLSTAVGDDLPILGVTKYKLSVLPPLMISRLIHRITYLFGVAHPPYGVAIITTMNDRLPPKSVAETAIHETAHLMGRHGYDPRRHTYGI